MMNRTKGTKVAVLASMIIVLLSFSMFAMLDPPSSGTQSTTYIIPMEDWVQNSDVGAVRLINTLLEANVSVYWALNSFSAGGNTYPAGTFYIPTPFTAMNGLSSNDLMNWFVYQAHVNGVWRIDTTTDNFTVNSKKLVLPRIALFYDTTTYDNALVNYEVLENLGFKITLVNALDLLQPWNETGSVLSQSNVFIMPGGALHLYAFPYNNMSQGINNIDEFVAHGGGFLSICAGSTETLANTPYTNLGLVNGSYFYNWFVYSSPTQGDWDWRTLIGPVYLNVTQPSSPVMFGYGPSASRPGYGPMPTMYYYGGPAFTNLSSSVTVLATYGAPVTQKDTPKVSDIWGAPAIVETNYGEGKVIAFGPHPEWPGPGADPAARMYAQALYYIASIPKPDPLLPTLSTTLSQAAISDQVGTITSTVAQIKPVLDDITRTADEIVNMRVGDHYNPAGLWYDQVLLEYGQAMLGQLNTIQTDTVRLQYEYAQLQVLKGMVQSNPQMENLVTYSEEMITKFFNYTENLPLDPMVIPSTDWTGMGPFANFTVADEATSFGQLTKLFVWVQNETSNVLLPFAQSYLPTYNEYTTLCEENQTSFTPSVNATLASLYMNITAYSPAAGPLYKGMDTFEHTLDIVQYKIDEDLLNIQTLASRTMEIVSQNDYALAMAVGPFNFASAQIQAALAFPEGALLSGS